MTMMTFWLAISLTPAAQAFCFNEAGAIYQIDPTLLKAIAQQESRLSAKAVNTNRDKRGRVLSVDDGLMQVNSTHIPRLQKMGVIRHPEDLLHQPCLNVKIGAWILGRTIFVNVASTGPVWGRITRASTSEMKRNVCTMPNRFMPTTGRWSAVTGEHRERGESGGAGTLRRPHAKQRGHGR